VTEAQGDIVIQQLQFLSLQAEESTSATTSLISQVSQLEFGLGAVLGVGLLAIIILCGIWWRP
jgi:hypothetical protein